MCRAVNYLDAIQTIVEQAKQDAVAMSEQISELDKRLSGFYHQLETSKFNVVTGYKLAKELQTLLLERREVKNEFYAMQSFTKHMVDNAKLDDRVRRMSVTLAKYREVMLSD